MQKPSGALLVIHCFIHKGNQTHNGSNHLELFMVNCVVLQVLGLCPWERKMSWHWIHDWRYFYINLLNMPMQI